MKPVYLYAHCVCVCVCVCVCHILCVHVYRLTLVLWGSYWLVHVSSSSSHVSSSLHYVQVDFSPLGKLLACFLVVAGVGLYAIPVGGCSSFFLFSFFLFWWLPALACTPFLLVGVPVAPLHRPPLRALSASRSRTRSLAFVSLSPSEFVDG